MAMIINSNFEIGEFVYLKTDVYQRQRVVFSLIVSTGEILYELACGTSTSKHYDFEISKELNELIKIS